MRLFTIPVLCIFTLLYAFTSAIPASVLSRESAPAGDRKAIPRATSNGATTPPIRVHCTNSPGKMAGTIFNKLPRNFKHVNVNSGLHYRDSKDLRRDHLGSRDALPIYWCQPGTSVFVALRVVANVASEQVVLALLQEAAGVLQDNMEHIGNSLLGPSGFNWIGEDNLDVRMWNTNDQQMAWSVCNSALYEVYTWMIMNTFSTLHFTIYEGATEVGEGFIG